jgi:hypothetical protein
MISADLPKREERLAKLGLSQTAGGDRVQTGYFRFSLDMLLNGGWLNQVHASDLEGTDEPGRRYFWACCCKTR